MRAYHFVFNYYAPYPIEQTLRIQASTLPAALGRAGREFRKVLGRKRSPKDLKIRVTTA